MSESGSELRAPGGAKRHAVSPWPPLLLMPALGSELSNYSWAQVFARRTPQKSLKAFIVILPVIPHKECGLANKRSTLFLSMERGKQGRMEHKIASVKCGARASRKLT